MKLSKAPIYPIGVQDFEKLRRRGFVYVDKTDLVYQLANTNTIYFLSRPRRFGKSLLISTFDAYFQGKRELFEGLAIAELEKDWTVYPVLRIDFSMRKYLNVDALNEFLDNSLCRFEALYGRETDESSYASRFTNIIRRAYEQTGQQVVILIDEYDAPMLDANSNPALQAELRNIIRDFFSVLKGTDAYQHFLFITGISKFSQMSIFSEISPDIYNPFSLLNALTAEKYDDYRFSSGTPTFLIELLARMQFDVTLLEDIVLPSTEFDRSTDTITDPIPVLYQSGYITIKAYNPQLKLYTLAYPNEEVRNGFINCLLPAFVHQSTGQNAFYIVNFVEDMLRGDIVSCLERTRAFFASIPNDLENKTEKHYQTIFYLLFRLMGQYIETEVKSAIGRADVVMKTARAIYVFEFKLDGTAQQAMDQIGSKAYAIPYTPDTRPVVKIGVNFDTATRTPSEWVIV